MREILTDRPGWGVAVVRVVLAGILLIAGWQKLGDIGFVATGFGKMGIPAPEIAAPLVVGLEAVGGALLLIGLFSRWVALLVAGQFVVATFYVKWAAQGFGAARLDLMILAAAVLVVLDGPGHAAVDGLWRRVAPARASEGERPARRRSA
jgi:putative oxidoreductase